MQRASQQLLETGILRSRDQRGLHTTFIGLGLDLTVIGLCLGLGLAIWALVLNYLVFSV